MSISIKGEDCGHNNELYDLVEAGRVLGRHPETVRRDVRYGNITGNTIERGVYFTQEDISRYEKTQSKYQLESN